MHACTSTRAQAPDGGVGLVEEVLGHATPETLRVYTAITDKGIRPV